MSRHITPEQAKAQAVKDATRVLQTEVQQTGQRPINAPRGNVNKTRTPGAMALGERIRKRPAKSAPRERPTTSGIENLLGDLLEDEEAKKEDEKGKIKVGDLLYDLKSGKALPPREATPIPQEDLPDPNITDKTQRFLDSPESFAAEDFAPQDRSRPFIDERTKGLIAGDEGIQGRIGGITKVGLDALDVATEFGARAAQFLPRQLELDPSALVDPLSAGIKDIPFVGEQAQPSNILEQLLQGALGLSPAQQRTEQRGDKVNLSPFIAPGRSVQEAEEFGLVESLGRGLPLDLATAGVGKIGAGLRIGSRLAKGARATKAATVGVRDTGTDLLGARVRRGTGGAGDVKAATKQITDDIAAAAGQAKRQIGDVPTSSVRALDEVTSGGVKTLRQAAKESFATKPILRQVSETFGKGTVSSPGKVDAASIAELDTLVKADTFLIPAEKEAASAVLKNIQGGEFIHDVQGLGNLGEIFGDEFVKNILRNSQHKASMWDQVLEVGNIPRTVLTSFDLSAPLRQGIALGVGNQKEFWSSFRMMFKAAKDENMARALDINMRRDVDFTRFTKRTQGKKNLEITEVAAQGVEFSRREEAVASAIATKVPGVKQSQRAYLAFLNKLRFDTAKSIVKGWDDTGTVVTDDMLDSLFNYINSATGRGPKLGPDKINEVANIVFFSPRLFTSRIALPLSMIRGAKPVQKIAQKQLLQALAAGSSLAMLLSLTGAADVELNPTSSAFGKIKIGRIQHDIWAGYTPIIRYTAQIITNQRKAQGTKTKSKIGGEVTGRGKVALNFLRSKLSPTASTSVNLMTGKDFLGRETFGKDSIFGKDVNEPTAFIWDTLTPLFIQELEEVVDETGWTVDAIHALPSFFGTGVGAFQTVEDVAQDTYGVPYTTLWPFEQDLTREGLRLAKGINEGTEYSRESERINQEYKDNIAAIAAGANSTNDFFMMQSYNAAVKERWDQLGQLGIDTFGPKDESFTRVWGGSEAQNAALKEYYDFTGGNDIPGTTLFNFQTYGAALAKLEAKWKAEGTLEYVQANTHKEEVPPVIFAAFNDAKRKRWVNSHNARQKRNKVQTRAGERPEGSIRSIPALGPAEFPLNPDTERFLEQGGAPEQDQPSGSTTSGRRRRGGPFQDDDINELARQFNIPISR